MGTRQLIRLGVTAGAAASVAATFALAGCASSSPRSSAVTSRAPARARASAPARGRDASYHSRGRLAGMRLWVNPAAPAVAQIRRWRADGNTRQATQLEAIARRATAVWLTGSTDPQTMTAAIVGSAQRAGAVAQLVLYDVPDRDCHGYSAGGADGPAAYLSWIGDVVRGLRGRPAIVIVEPDALDQAASGGCLSPAQASARYALIAQAVGLLHTDRLAHVYIDAGHPGWLTPSQLAPALRAAGIAHAAGFSVNVANFETTGASIAYGDALSRQLGGAHFVIDTSRNGNGPPPQTAGSSTAEWCNPPGRHIGAAPTTDTGHALVDAYLWVKYPGESDGSCAAGQPPAGTWWPAYALGLVAPRSH